MKDPYTDSYKDLTYINRDNKITMRRYLMSYYDRFEYDPYSHDYNVDNCVYDTVREIIIAQDKVADDGCSTSCDSAIQQLHRQGKEPGPRFNTVPFILYSKGTCKPFIGSGIFKNPKHTGKRSFFGCIETPVFRAKHFIKNSDYCVKLELLVPASEGYEIKGYCTNRAHHACSFFPEENPVTGFFATGICLTVDLDQFMGITCLDPINPIQ